MKSIFFLLISLLSFFGFWIVAIIGLLLILLPLWLLIAPFWGGEEWIRRRIINLSSSEI